MSTTVGKRIVQYSYGDPSAVLTVEEGIALPVPKPGEVLVLVTRSMIHPGDLQLVAARYTTPGIVIPEGRVPGLEAAGVIADAAAGALDGTGLAIGDRVMFFAPGAWQTRALVPAGALVLIPEDLSDDVATQLLINTITARHVLRTALSGLATRPDHVLQTGAASAVGRLITAFALDQGLTPIRLVRSAESAARLAEMLPGGHIIDTSQPNWQETVRDAAGGDVALVTDGVGGPLIAEIAGLLCQHSRIALYGLLSDAPADLSQFLMKSLSLVGVTIGTWGSDTSPADQDGDRQAAITAARRHPALFAGHRTFDLAALNEAVVAVTAPGKFGNILLTF